MTKQSIEIWKSIENYPEYMISNLGNVKAINWHRGNKEKEIKPYTTYKGYLRTGLRKNGKTKQFLIHRLVAQAFIPNPENKLYVDHINTDRTDNRVENLRWVTNKENCNNPISKINYSIGNKGKTSKPILQFDKNMNFIRQWSCITDVKRELGFNNGHISSCCLGKRKTANGYIWRFVEQENEKVA